MHVKHNRANVVVILISVVRTKGSLPAISRVVDCMNYISVSIWDPDIVAGCLTYKLSKGGERYWPFMAVVQ